MYLAMKPFLLLLLSIALQCWTYQTWATENDSAKVKTCLSKLSNICSESKLLATPCSTVQANIFEDCMTTLNFDYGKGCPHIHGCSSGSPIIYKKCVNDLWALSSFIGNNSVYAQGCDSINRDKFAACVSELSKQTGQNVVFAEGCNSENRETFKGCIEKELKAKSHENIPDQPADTKIRKILKTCAYTLKRKNVILPISTFGDHKPLK